MKVILQNSEQDCLLACVCMIMNNHGYDFTPGQLINAELLPADGLSLGDLKTIEEHLGIRTRGFKDPDGLILEDGEITNLPLIETYSKVPPATKNTNPAPQKTPAHTPLADA